MALEATHIRFALDLRGEFEVKDLDKFVSGAIYPDSRYITKIDRNVTHSKEFLGEDFYRDDDFKKGWFLHLVCDLVQTFAFENIFSDILNKEEKTSASYWFPKTSLKILQDLDDITKFPIRDYLKCLEYSETPNGEDASVMEAYNQIFIDMYKKEDLGIQGVVDMWIKLKIDAGLASRLNDVVNQLSVVDKIKKRIPLVYPKMMDSYKDFI